MNDIFPFDGIDLIYVMNYFKSFFSLESGFPGVDLGRSGDPLFRKKLLRFSTGLSTRSVVRPIDFAHIGSSSCSTRSSLIKPQLSRITFLTNVSVRLPTLVSETCSLILLSVEARFAGWRVAALRPSLRMPVWRQKRAKGTPWDGSGLGPMFW